MASKRLEWKLLRTSSSGETPLLITPLIDIMFLILIFFVLNTNLNRFSPLEIDLPNSDSTSENVEETLTLILGEKETITIQDREVSIDRLEMDLTGLDEKYDNIIIAGDESISYSFLIDVMDEVEKAGFNHLILLRESQD